MSATAQRILAVGSELLQTKGYHAFSYRDLADRLSIRPASIHYHFPAKQDLALAIAEMAFEAFKTQAEAIRQNQSDIRERLRALSAIFASTFGQGDRLCPICMLAVCQESVPEVVQGQVRAFWSWCEAWLTEVLSDGIASGQVVPTLPAPVAARAWIAAVEGSLLIARSFKDPRRVVETSEFILERVIGVESCTATRQA